MRPSIRRCRRTLEQAILLVILLAAPRVAMAGQLHVRDSSPAAEAIVRGRHAEYVIRFDGPVDHVASRMDVIQAGRVIHSLIPLADSAADVLFASGETPPVGRYLLHWQAVSRDGEVSIGDIAFSVEP